MEETLLEGKKVISKEVLLLKHWIKIRLDFLAKTGFTEGAELIIFSVFCGVKRNYYHHSAGNGNATCPYHHFSISFKYLSNE